MIIYFCEHWHVLYCIFVYLSYPPIGLSDVHVVPLHFGRSVSDLGAHADSRTREKTDCWLCTGIVRGCSWLQMHCWFGVKYNAVRG